MNRGKEWLPGVPVEVIFEVGRTEKEVGEIMQQWRKDTVIKLDDSVVNELKVYFNNEWRATGVVLKNKDGEMGVKIVKKR